MPALFAHAQKADAQGLARRVQLLVTRNHQSDIHLIIR